MPRLPGAASNAIEAAPPYLARARSSAGEHYLDMVGVTGSIPVAPTIQSQGTNMFRE